MRTEKTRLLRSGEVAKRLGLHPLTVRRWVKEGKIAAVQIGREARIPIDSSRAASGRTARRDDHPVCTSEWTRPKRGPAASGAAA
jgi:excisionase family DNA binding protein